MSLPVRHLPVIQSWDCHACGQCCKEYTVHVTDDERKRIIAQKWDATPELASVATMVRDGFLSGRYRLNHTADGSCVFLDEKGLCRIHAKYGEDQKPLACRVYPYVLVPTGDHWRVGMRYACPSATANKGRPVTLQKPEITRYAQELELREGVRGRLLLPTALRGWQRVSWDDLDRFTRALTAIVADSSQGLELRLRKILALSDLCRHARFEKVNGHRLEEFLAVVTQGLDSDFATASRVELPSSLGRVLFRLTAAVYCRRDSGAKRGAIQRRRIGLIGAAIRFARGRGPLPKLHALLPEVSFEQMEQSDRSVSKEVETLLERYYRVKLESYQFFGPIHFGYRYWDGLEALLLTFPVTCWLSRAFVHLSNVQAMEAALQIVDDNFGYNPLLGTRRQRRITRTLAARGDLARLIALYGS